MAFNGAGTFARIYNWVADKANNVKITASRMDAEMDGFATGLSNCVTKDGQTQPTADLPMNGHRHTGVAAGTARTHYADVGSVQDGAYLWCGTAGGTANALTLAPAPAITAYAAGQMFRFTAGASPNSAATTVAVSGLAAKAVQLNNAALAGGEILAGKTYAILYDGTQFQLFGSLSLNSQLVINRSGSTGKTDDIKLIENSYGTNESHNLYWETGGFVLGRLGVEYPGGSDYWLYVRDLYGGDAARTGITFGFKGTNGAPANFAYAQAGTSGSNASIATNAAGLTLAPFNNIVSMPAINITSTTVPTLGLYSSGSNLLSVAVGSAQIQEWGTGGSTIKGVFVPDSARTRSVGTASLPFGEMLTKTLFLNDSDNNNFLGLDCTSDLTATRKLHLATGDADRTLTMTADATLSGSPIVQGVHEFYVDAGAMLPAATNGPGAGTTETSSNKVNFSTLDFDQTTREYAWFKIRMPKSWNNGTITYIAEWTASGGSGGVTWELGGVAVSNDDAIDAAISSAQNVSDTLIAAGDQHSTAESAAFAIVGSPAAGDTVYFRISRVPSDGSDTLTADAKLLGLTIRCTINAASDA